MFQLGILLLIGIIAIVTVSISLYLMSQSRKNVTTAGNVAELTITIPESKLEESVSTSSNTTTSIYSGKTPADLNLQTYLASQNYNYVFSKNLSLYDITTNNSFLLSLANENTSLNDNVVNGLVLNSGVTAPSAVYSSADNSLINDVLYFYAIRELAVNNSESYFNLIKDIFDYNTYLSNKPWLLASMLSNSVWNLNDSSKQKILNVMNNLTTRPDSEDGYYTYFYPFTSNDATYTNYKWNTNSYFYKLVQMFSLSSVSYNGYGYSILASQVIPLIGTGGDIPFTISYYDTSSYFAVISSNYMTANKGTKAVLDERTIKQASALPYKNNDVGTANVKTYTVYNQDTGKDEPQVDFITWFNNLDSKYKVSINSLSYVITGIGDAPNLLYPVQSSTQLIIDSKSTGAAYVNAVGFERALAGGSYKPTVYYSVRYPPSATWLNKPSLLTSLKNWTKENYGTITAFSLKDRKQTNDLFYVWANFLGDLQQIIATIGLIIGGLVIFLGLVFISLLIRSIIKLNKATFGVGLANGVSKTKLALSFWIFALVPAVVFGTLAYFCGYYLVYPLLNVIRQYWTISISDPLINIGLLAILVVSSFIVLYTLIIVIIFVTLRQNTQTILNSSNSLKVNPLITYTKSLTNKLSPLWSFRATFMMSNISRFVILLFSVVYIISLSSIIVATNNLFTNSLASITENKKYSVAYDLYSPTINSGYYSSMEYDMLGTSQQGVFNGYNTEGTLNYNKPSQSNGSYYNTKEFDDALAHPFVSGLYFTSLFMTNSNVANDINYNIQFMDNRVFSKILLDVEVNALGATVNPWEFSKQIMPESVTYLAEQNTENLIQTSYDFYYWLQQQNDIAVAGDSSQYINMPELEGTIYSQFNNVPITYKTYLPNVDGQPFTLDSSDITTDYNTASNKNQWIFIRKTDNTTNKEIWAINQDYAINGAPSYTIKAKAAKLMVEIMTNNDNPLFQFWYKYCYDKNPNKGQANQTIPDYNYKLSAQSVPVDNGDETYTYLKSTLSYKKFNSSIKIEGIKPNSNLVYLYDKNNKDLKTALTQFATKTTTYTNSSGVEQKVTVYPVVINNVVAKKYGLKVGNRFLTETSNTFDRFNLINIGENPNYTAMFQVVGITNTNYGQQFYTLQSYANEILGYKTTTTGSEAWTSDIEPGKGYIPFNGVYSSNANLQMIQNYGGFYSPSGLSTILGEWGSDPSDDTLGTIGILLDHNKANLDEYSNLNKFVDRSNNNAITTKTLTADQKLSETTGVTWSAADKLKKIISLFDSTAAIVTQLQTFDSPYIYSTMGTSFDGVITQVGIITILAMTPTLIIIITLLAVIIIFESSRLISLLKILGYKDLKNMFSFMFVYVAVLFLGTILAIPISYAILGVLKTIMFNMFQIIAVPVVQGWTFILGFGIVGLIFAGLFIFVYKKMKKINLAQEISVR